METFWQDIRFALRTLRRTPAVTLLVTTSLALAIGGNTAVFSLINGLLYRPLPFAEPHRLAFVSERSLDQPRGRVNPVSAANFLDLREQQESFRRLAAFRRSPLSYDRGGDQPEQLSAAAVSPELFDVLGVPMLLGRGFLPEEGLPGKQRVAVLTHEYWVETFAADERVLAETMKLNGETYHVVGVLPEDFEFLDPTIQLYVALALDPTRVERHRRDLFAVGRLRPRISDDRAQAEMRSLLGRLAEEYPEANRGYTADVLNLREEMPDPQNRLFLGLIQGALIFVLLIACVNAANLLLARSQRREREIAIRSSLGAGHRRIVRQLLTESLLMALISGTAGLALAGVVIRVLCSSLSAILTRHYHPVIDGHVVVFNLGASLLAGLLFGLAPVLQTYRFNLLSALKDGTQAATSSKSRRLASNALVVFELALALVFLGGANVMLNSFAAVQRSDPGFETRNLLTARLTLPESRYGSNGRLAVAVEELRQRLESLPGVRAAAISNAWPRSQFVPRDVFSVDALPRAPDQLATGLPLSDRPLPDQPLPGRPLPGRPLPRAIWIAIDPGYFQTLGIARRRGRPLTTADRAGAPAVAVINEAMAERFWGGGSGASPVDPIGQRLTIQGRSREIVGVVANVRHGLAISSDLAPAVYFPWAQHPANGVVVCLRTEVDAKTLIDAVRREVMAFDPGVAITRMEPLDDFIDRFWVGQNIFAAILRGFGSLALLLAALGTYGVLACSVVQRNHEIGVRMAIGADRWQVVRMITRQGLALAGLGIALGIPGLIVVHRAISSLFADSVPVESGAIIAAGALLLAVTLVASFLPARRAASVDPMRALRCE